MATQTFQRQLAQIITAYAGDIDTGYIHEADNKFYIPFTFNNFTSPDLTPTVNATTSQSKLTATVAGGFDNVRVGDILVSLSGAGAITAKATFDRTCYCPRGLNYVVYPHTFTSSTLNVQAGDAVTSATTNVLPAGVFVDKIDYATRRIFLTDVVGTAGDAVDALTFAPPVRVTAVRTSTALANANQIDIDSTISTGGTGLTATISNGAREAVSHVLRVEPLSNTTGSKATYTVSVSTLTGLGVIGSANGLNNIDVTTLSYSTAGTYSFDADEFLVKARLPRPTTAA